MCVDTPVSLPAAGQKGQINSHTYTVTVPGRLHQVPGKWGAGRTLAGENAQGRRELWPTEDPQGAQGGRAW